ncbi:unnamed protein product [Acanthoscelides obtectus]|nr:unnamed protein product [Acanthoscelides obtectus]CAK1664878.1 Probable serine hydrolase [Acanthoscelides obtectus]
MLDKNVGFLAIDLPGHGLSSRLPPGMYYSSSCYLITLNYIRDFLQWDNISFIGHSLGALIAYTYCMMHQDRVDFLICLDGSKPLVTENFIKHMAMLLDKFLEYNKFAFSLEEPPSYTIDEIKQKIAKPNDNSVDLEYAHCLMERSIAPSKLHPGKYYITKDPRLRIGEVMSFSHEQLIQSARYLTSPICIIKATGSSYYEDKNNFYKVIDLVKRASRDFDFHYVDGTHHVHLNHPERVAGIVNSFIGRHNVTA